MLKKVIEYVIEVLLGLGGAGFAVWSGYQLCESFRKDDPQVEIEKAKLSEDRWAQRELKREEYEHIRAMNREAWQQKFTETHFKEGYYFDNYGELNKVEKK